jgi:hypothetical protein
MSMCNDDTRNKYIQDIIDEVVPKSCQNKITNTGYSLSYNGKTAIGGMKMGDIPFSVSWKIDISFSNDLVEIKNELRNLVQKDNFDRDYDLQCTEAKYHNELMAKFEKENKECIKREDRSEAMSRLMKNISIVNQAIKKLNKCWFCKVKNRNNDPVAYLEKPSSSTSLDEIINAIIDSIEFANALYRKECILCKWTTELL